MYTPYQFTFLKNIFYQKYKTSGQRQQIILGKYDAEFYYHDHYINCFRV